ncbi:hypothetical protein ABTX82_39005 [Streptomyces lavendulae]|uniref:hypothetical protein n=1 Tax=Streptomyces lavendulae TaxID=1914 RepID=UPI00332C9FAA
MQRKAKVHRKLDRKEMVQLCMRDVSMVVLASFLAERCDFEIYVPARAFEKKVTKKLSNVPLESALRELGMIIPDPA